MPPVLLFIEDKAPRRLEINEFRSHISYLYPDNVARLVPVQIIFSTFQGGKGGAVMVAADRQVTRDEIARAYKRLIGMTGLTDTDCARIPSESA